jgi:hypothetical protein
MPGNPRRRRLAEERLARPAASSPSAAPGPEPGRWSIAVVPATAMLHRPLSGGAAGCAGLGFLGCRWHPGSEIPGPVAPSRGAAPMWQGAGWNTGWSRLPPARIRIGAAFSSEGRGNRYLASRVSLAARLPRAGPCSRRLRPARCESVPAGAGTPPHRAGCCGGIAARDGAGTGTTEADAGDQARGSRWPGRACSSASARTGAHSRKVAPHSHRAGRSPRRPGPIRM